MNHFRSQSIIRQFPEVVPLLIFGSRQWRDCEACTVTRATRDLLLSVPQHTTQDGSCVDINERTDVHFVLSNGTVINNAVYQEETFRSHAAHAETHHREGESIVAAIARHGVADTLAYIVRAHYGYEVVDHYSTRTWRAEIIRPAKGFTWGTIEAEQQERADAALWAAIAAQLG